MGGSLLQETSHLTSSRGLRPRVIWRAGRNPLPFPGQEGIYQQPIEAGHRQIQGQDMEHSKHSTGPQRGQEEREEETPERNQGGHHEQPTAVHGQNIDGL